MNPMLLSSNTQIFIGRSILDSDNGKWAWHRLQSEYGVSYEKFVTYYDDFLADFTEAWNRLPIVVQRSYLVSYQEHLTSELSAVTASLEQCGIEAEMK